MSPSLKEIRETFTENGFAIIPNLFKRAEVQALKGEIRQILETVRREAAEAGRAPEAVADHGVYVGLAIRSAVFREAVKDERLLDILEVILAPNIEFLSDKVVFKGHQMDFASPWHQDWHYWHGAHKVSLWVALDDATVENGCLKLYPGSHKSAIIHDGKSDDGHGFGHRLRPDALDESRAVTAEIEAGGAVFFHDLTLHSSHPNRSGADRWVWIPTYRDAQADDTDYSWAVAAAVVRGTGG
jgi:phytanoyl-CoA hydroxylase